MTVQKLKQRLIDRIGDELLKPGIESQDFINFAQAVFILMDSEICHGEHSNDTEQSNEKFDLDKFWGDMANLYKPNKKD